MDGKNQKDKKRNAGSRDNNGAGLEDAAVLIAAWIILKKISGIKQKIRAKED
jgi:hypothetical protein